MKAHLGIVKILIDDIEEMIIFYNISSSFQCEFTYDKYIKIMQTTSLTFKTIKKENNLAKVD